MATTLRELVTEWGFDIDDRPLRQMDRSIKGLKSSLATVGIGIAAVGGLVGGVFLRQAGIYEQAQIAFETMLGSADRAKTLLKDISSFAAKTPFEIQGLVDSSKRLLAFGFAAEEIIPTMESLGNISAGVGREKLPQLILALGQVRAATKLRGQELRQFTEAGVPLIEEIAKLKGIAEKEVADMVSKGKISFRDTEAALRNLTSGSGRFANLMIKQSKSLFGIISNLKDNFTILAIEIGQSLLPETKKVASGILEWVDANKELIKTKVLFYTKELIKFFKGLLGILYSIGLVLRSTAMLFGGVEKSLQLLLKVALAFIALKFAIHLGALVSGAAQVAAGFAKMGTAGLIAQAKILAIPLAIGAAIAAIGLIIEDIVAYFQGKDSLTGRMIREFQKNFPQATVFISEFFGYFKSQIMLVVNTFKFLWSWVMIIARGINRIFAPVFNVMRQQIEFITGMFKIINQVAGKVAGFSVQGALDRFRGIAGGLQAGGNFLAGITPKTAPTGAAAGGGVNQNIQVRPEMTINVNGGATNEDTANAVGNAVTGAFEKVLRETGRDFAPAIER